MNLWHAIFVVAGLGALGGVANCLISGEFKLPRWDREAEVWRPGWIGNVLIGSIAAVVVWGVYGPAGSLDLAQPDVKREVHLTVAQLLSSIVIGLSGGTILTSMAQKDAERMGKRDLAEAMDRITKGGE